MFRPRLRIPRAAAGFARPPLRRSMHHLPPLPHDFREGVPGLLSAEGFDMAWTQHMTLMLEKLNALIAGTQYEHRDNLKSVILATAREPSLAPIFNHASMAHNNHIFFKNLSPAPVEIPSTLREGLEASFSSIDTLRREFVATASAMFGPGFVWLVKTGKGHATGSADNYRILATYLAGSPYPGAHWRRQATDMSTVGGATPDAQSPVEQYFRKQEVGATRPGLADDFKKTAPGGIDVIPLLCVNTWEHVWLRDYGLGVGGYGGKRAFVEAWWDTIDWDAVASAANISRPTFKA
ncbi:hypothetical protein NKR23_g10403 [Pleurostoma richardsiae]|uniref:Manganese/iron superoxide dismutase C-terminal domain-containing protein n=1 Tax=Pleurostoma richardsiae TaxID=41990 RepID=A0AA38R4H0_9PEZI|nr:hypothetical protein NKR23_g10403 [Pleurostoma richardsiae]